MGVNLLQHTPLLHDNAPTGTQQWVTYSCPLLPTQERLSIGRCRADPRILHRPSVADMTPVRCATGVSAFYPIPMARPRRQPRPPALRPVPQRRDVSECPQMSHLEHVALSPPPDSRPLGEWRRMTQNDSLEKKPSPAPLVNPCNLRVNDLCHSGPFRSVLRPFPSFPCAIPALLSAGESQRRGRGNDG